MNGRQEKDFDIHLREGGVIRVRFTDQRGRIITFTVQYEPFIEGRFRPTVRYDTAHSRPHRDTLDWHGRPIRGSKDWLPDSMDANDPLTFAINDLKQTGPITSPRFSGDDHEYRYRERNDRRRHRRRAESRRRPPHRAVFRVDASGHR